MKKITQLFLTILFTGIFALVNAQGVYITGTFVNGNNSGVDFVADYGTGIDSFTTDSSGYFNEFLATSGSQGAVVLNYLDCNSNSQSVSGSWSPASQTIDFGYIDLCPSTTPYDATATIELTGVSSSVSVSYSWDNGTTWQTGSTNSAGIFSNTLVGTTGIGTFAFEITDCNGNTISGNDGFSISNPNLNFGPYDYCPSLCTASFGLSQAFTIDSLTQTITYYGPIIITDYSVNSDPTYFGPMFHTWDFGDGSPTYTGTNFTHTYTNAGAYYLCLTINSNNGCTDTYCDSLVVNANGVLSGKTNGGFTLQMGNGDNETEGPLAINNLQNDVALNIYPNPASNNLNIAINSELKETMSIAIYDLSGKLVQQNKLDVSIGNQVLNIELNLNKGMYIAQLKSRKGTLSSKLTIK